MDEGENEHKLRGYIPAGWYPSCVVSDGNKLLIVDAKGTTTRYPNPPANTPATSPRRPRGAHDAACRHAAGGQAGLAEQSCGR